MEQSIYTAKPVGRESVNSEYLNRMSENGWKLKKMSPNAGGRESMMYFEKCEPTEKGVKYLVLNSSITDENKLNRLGMDGWKICAVTPPGTGTVPISLIFAKEEGHKYEYKTLQVNEALKNDGLNRLGNESWELVAANSPTGVEPACLFFMREPRTHKVERRSEQYNTFFLEPGM